MKATIDLKDEDLELFVKNSVEKTLSKMDVNKIIENKINNKVDKMLNNNLSNEKLENFTRDRISRIITVESLKNFSNGINNEDVLSNVESKILLMIKNSKDFKILVKQTMKNSL
jgi:hypothetical protein